MFNNRRYMLMMLAGVLILSTVFPLAGIAQDKELILVDDGKANAVVVWWSFEETPVPSYAATEMSDYLQKMSGATIPVRRGTLIEASDAEMLDLTSGILIATGDDIDALDEVDGHLAIPGEWLASTASRLAGAKEDAFVIETRGDTLLLTGANDRGTLYAAYDLLERLGVQFIAPNFDVYEGHGEYIPTQATVSLAPLDTMEEPRMKLRRKYVEEGWSHSAHNLPQLIDWMAKNKLNTFVVPFDYISAQVTVWDDWREQLIPELEKRDMIVEVGGHGFESFLRPSKYQDAHPEWFVPGHNVFDLANEAAVEAYIAEVVSYLKERPEIDIFDAWPPDVPSWPASVINKFGSPSNAYAYVINKLNETVQEELPGVRIEAIAYSNHTEPPDAEYMYDDSIIIDFAPYARSYRDAIFDPNSANNKNFVDLITRWTEVFDGDLAMYEYYRRYAFRSLPIVFPHLIGQEVPYYASLGLNGIGAYSEPADWITYETMHYTLAKMSWDARTNAETLMADYMQTRYGTAAAEMSEYLTLIEEAGRELFHTVTGRFNDLTVVTQARNNYLQAKTHIQSALANVETDSSAAFLLQRLLWNTDYAIADIEDNYYRLTNDDEEQEAANKRAFDLLTAHRFNGIALMNSYAMRPHPAIGNNKWLYDMNRGKAAVNLAVSAPDYTRQGRTIEVSGIVRNFSRDSIKNVDLHLEAPRDWSVKAISPTSFEQIRSLPDDLTEATWEVTVPENTNFDTYELKITANYTYDGERIGSQSKKVISVPQPPERTAWISDLEWISAENYWGPVERDMSNGEQAAGDGKTLSINGKTFEKGLGVHAPSEVVYFLGGNVAKFQAMVGVDDEVPASSVASIVFQVWGDGEKLYDSGLMVARDEAKPVDIDVKGVEVLSLVVTDGGNGPGSDHGDWADARFIVTTSAADIKTTVKHLGEADEITEGARRSLERHLTAVSRFEKQEAVDKIVKHMEGFKRLLDYQKDNGLMSEGAYRLLKADAEYVLEQWK